jgi:hypothetical protein
MKIKAKETRYRPTPGLSLIYLEFSSLILHAAWRMISSRVSSDISPAFIIPAVSYARSLKALFYGRFFGFDIQSRV